MLDLNLARAAKRSFCAKLGKNWGRGVSVTSQEMFQSLCLLCEAWRHPQQRPGQSPPSRGSQSSEGDDLEEARMGQMQRQEECSRQRREPDQKPRGWETSPGRGWSGRALCGHLVPHLFHHGVQSNSGEVELA